MLVLIPVISNDYVLAIIYGLIIAVALMVKYEPRDFLFLGFGFVIMIIAEYLFIMTGVEVFFRDSLFGVMPIWLPLLWAYAFVVMERSIMILNQ